LGMDVYDAQCFLRGSKYDEKKYREFVLHLRESLIQQNYIDEVREDEWITMFEGHSINLDDQFSFRWQLANSHCVYLFEILEKKDIIKKLKLDNTINRFFNIKNVAQTRYSYFPKPRGAEDIDKIVINIMTHLGKF